MVAYLDIVAQVRAVHQEVTVSDACSAFGVCGTCHNHVLADVVLVTNKQQAVFSLIVEVLRHAGQHGSVVYGVFPSHAGTVQDVRARHDDTVVADFYIAFNIGERLYCYVLAELCGRINVC